MDSDGGGDRRRVKRSVREVKREEKMERTMREAKKKEMIKR